MFSNINTKTFELFLGWLYQDKFNFRECSEYEESMLDNAVDLLIFADKFGIRRLGDEVMDGTRQYLSETGTFPFTTYVGLGAYETLSPECGLREYLARTLAYQIFQGDDWLTPSDIAIDMERSKGLCEHVLTILRREGPTIANPTSGSKCRFHYHHYSGKPCPYGGPGT